MKKIFILTAVFALLSMSLNAQVAAKAQRSLPINKSLSELMTDKAPNMMNGNGNSMSKAPLRANLGEGEYILGPYTSDAYNNTGWGLTNNVSNLSSAAAIMIGVDMELPEYQDYLGDEIVGYRFATIGNAYIYEVFVLPMSENYLSTDNMIEWVLADNEGYPEEFTTSGWHEYRLDTPIEFTFPDSIVSFWLGYEYYQPNTSSTMNKTPVAYNSSSTSHMDRMYWNSGFYNMSSYIGGDIAVQLIMRRNAGPELTAPTNGSTVNVGTNDGFGASTTVNVSGNNLTADLSVSVSGTGFSVSPTTITAADANAGTTVTVTYNGTDPNATGTLTITSGNGEVSTVTVNLTASYAASTAIQGGLLRLHLLMVDQFKEEIPDDNKHPEAYGYVLKYEPEVGDPKVSGKPDVRIQKTKAKVNGYYTKAEIDGDTDAGLTLNVLSADVEMDLDNENPDILYFEMKGKKDAAPTIEDPYLTKLQYMKNIGMYEEMEQTSPNLGAHYNPAETHHYYDASTPIMTGGTTSFMTYAPMVSTWGVERRYFEDDGLDNTYGAPIWKTAVGQVEIQGKPSLQKQVINAGTVNEAPNPSTSWTVDGQLYTLYFMGVSAQGTMPNPEITNINYEPYMFRVFVEGDNLRKFVPVLDPETGVRIGLSDGGLIEGKYCVGSFDASTGTWSSSDLFFNKEINEDTPTSSNPGWEGNIMFGAPFDLNSEDLTVYVRFYYMVEGWNANRDGDARPGNGSESPGATPDDPSTYVHEFVINGEVVSRTYVNAQGMQSDKPFDGLNIVITRYSDGTTITTKVMR